MDTTKTNPYRSFLAVAAGLLLLIGTAFTPAAAEAEVQCSFYRDLATGSYGTDVTCLHQYLNTQGYAGSGPSYTVQTRASVAAWQAQNGIFPAQGYFGFVSRSRYSQLVGSYQTTGGQTVIYPTTTAPQAFSSKEVEALEKLRRAHDLIEETWDDYNDALDDDDDVNDAADYLDDAEADLLDGIYAFLDRDYSDAIDFAEDAIDNAEDAEDEIDGNSGNGGDREDARDAIDDAQDAIDDARDEIDEADDDGADVDEADDLLDDAEDALEDAEDAYDDGDYDDAEDFANDAEELADDAVDAIDF